jgi:hypothetical protein
MSEQPGTGSEPDKGSRRRRIAEVFGDVLPETTSDERDEGAGDRASDGDRDEWFRSQVPPHHG